MLDYLVKLHWLGDCDIRDRRKVGEAIAWALLESAEADWRSASVAMTVGTSRLPTHIQTSRHGILRLNIEVEQAVS